MKLLIYIPLIITYLFISGIQLSGQEKVNLTLGIGFPELLNMGIRYQAVKTQLGISIGFMPVASFFEGEKDNKMISISSDFYYHFGGVSRLSTRRPWYSRTGLIYCDAADGNNLLWLNGRLGRDFNLSEKFGFSIDAGFILELFNEEKRNDPQLYSDTYTFLLPGIGANIFYRIGHN